MIWRQIVKEGKGRDGAGYDADAVVTRRLDDDDDDSREDAWDVFCRVSYLFLRLFGCQALYVYQFPQLLHPFRSKHLLREAFTGGSSPLSHGGCCFFRH